MTIRGFAFGLLVVLVVPAIIALAFLTLHDRSDSPPPVTASPTVKSAVSPLPARTVFPTRTPKAGVTPTPAMSPSPSPTTTPTTTPATSLTVTKTPPPSPTEGRYQSETRDIPAGTTLSVTFTVPSNFILDGYFTVSGSDQQLTFWATGRGGETVISKKKVEGHGEFNLPGRQGATYILNFENAKSPAASKKVTVFYRLSAE